MKREKSARKLLKKYINWTIVAAVLFAFCAVAAFLFGVESKVVVLIGAGVGIVFVLIIYLSYNGSITKALTEFAMSTHDKQVQLATELDIPYAILDEKNSVAWENEKFKKVFQGEGQKLLNDILQEKGTPSTDNKEEYDCIYRDRKYKVVIESMQLDGEPALACFFYDETAYRDLLKKYDNDLTVVGLIYLDNYEEAMESIEEVKRSLLIALVDRKVSKYISDLDGIVKKPEKDKYIFLIKKMYLSQLESERFDILEEVKKVNIGNEMNITASIGAGIGSDSLSGNYELARGAIDMALARGGDQAVVKDGDAIRYYGGKSMSVEKNTKVKARVKAQAFREIIESSDKLIIMGHRMLDIDCLGSAIGIWRMANTFGKKAYILANEKSPSLEPMLTRFTSSDYPEDMFVDNAKAMDLVTEDTALVVVDVNRPSFTGAPELLDVVSNVVVFDHHRQGSEKIEHTTLSYIEPFASSTSEMVTEIIQYISDKVRLRPTEADALYAGMVIDTYNFTNQAGVRTFEAAAFLRKNGADVTRVRKLFRDDIEDYKIKAEAIHNAQIYRDAYAMTECKAAGLESPTIIGAQTANELLDINGVKASLVFTEYDGKVFISARSIDEVNVQLIMEKLGGGGHRSIAGAQLESVSVIQAMDVAKAVIEEMITKGELEQ